MTNLLTPEQLAAIEARAAKQALAELRKEAIDKCHGDFGAPDLNPEYQISLSLLVREVYAILNSEEYINALLAHARDQAATIAALEAKVKKLEYTLEYNDFKLCENCGEFASVEEFCDEDGCFEPYCLSCFEKAKYQCDECGFRTDTTEEFDGKCGMSGCCGSLISRAVSGAEKESK
jgi:hypothetical protein